MRFGHFVSRITGQCLLCLAFLTSSAAAQQCYLYEVTIQGDVNLSSGGILAQQPFTVTEYLYIRDPGFSQNPFDFAFLA